MFVDESGVATNMARLYGRAPRGERARRAAPPGRRERLTIPGGLTLGGLTAFPAVAGAADTAVLCVSVERALVPALRPGQTVVLDGVSVHRAARVRHPAAATGCRLHFAAPYSPDRNPVDPAWSKPALSPTAMCSKGAAWRRTRVATPLVTGARTVRQASTQ